MVLVGLDPSYARTGISIYCNGKIIIDERKTEPNKDKSFEAVYKDACEQVDRIMMAISDILIEEGSSFDDVTVMSECPPPQGSYSPGLYGLDSLLFHRIQREGWLLYRLYPTYIMHVHGKRNFAKSESVEIAKYILDNYEYRLKSKRLSHDESESIIFLARNMAMHGVLKENILSKYKGLGSKKEKLISC